MEVKVPLHAPAGTEGDADAAAAAAPSASAPRHAAAHQRGARDSRGRRGTSKASCPSSPSDTALESSDLESSVASSAAIPSPRTGSRSLNSLRRGSLAPPSRGAEPAGAGGGVERALLALLLEERGAGDAGGAGEGERVAAEGALELGGGQRSLELCAAREQRCEADYRTSVSRGVTRKPQSVKGSMKPMKPSRHGYQAALACVSPHLSTRECHAAPASLRSVAAISSALPSLEPWRCVERRTSAGRDVVGPSAWTPNGCVASSRKASDVAGCARLAAMDQRRT